jgi:hypothetical protein
LKEEDCISVENLAALNRLYQYSSGQCIHSQNQVIKQLTENSLPSINDVVQLLLNQLKGSQANERATTSTQNSLEKMVEEHCRIMGSSKHKKKADQSINLALRLKLHNTSEPFQQHLTFSANYSDQCLQLKAQPICLVSLKDFKKYP